MFAVGVGVPRVVPLIDIVMRVRTLSMHLVNITLST